MPDQFKCKTDHREDRFDDPILFDVPDDVVWETDYRDDVVTGYLTATVTCPTCGAEVKLMKQDKEQVNG